MNIVRFSMLIFYHTWLSLMPTVPVAVHWNFCLLCIWTAFYQGVMWCMPISINTTPPGGDVEAQHFSQLKVPKTFFTFCPCILKHSLLISCFFFLNLWITSCSMLDVFVWYVFFNCLVMFYNITNEIRGLIRPLQEPETLLMPFVFFLYLPHNTLKRPDRV